MFFTDLKQTLEEQRRSVVVFTFGRFQPPTSGHELLINKTIKEAAKRKGEHRIYTSHAQNKKNPLSYRSKLDYMRKFFPQANIIDDPNAINAFVVCQQLSDEGYKNVVMVVGSDRVREFKTGIEKYIGKPDGYKFDSFEVVSAGERDPDAKGVSGMSASKMRLAATQNDLSSFTSGMPSKASKRDTQKLFHALQKYLGVNESMINESIRKSQLKTIVKDKEVKKLLKAIYKEPHETIAIALLSLPSVEHIIGSISDKTITDFMQSVPDLIKHAGIRESTYTPRHPIDFISEVKTDDPKKTDKDVVVIALTKGEGDESTDTVNKLKKSCKQKNITYHTIRVGEAFVVDDDLNDNKMIIYNYDGDGNELKIEASNTCCFVRGGSLVDISGQGLVKTLEEAGVFMINRLSSMEQCQNKFSTSIALQKDNVPHPKTALVTNEESIEVVHKKIGGKFPVVVKTITGAEGIGVMIVESMASMKSVLQGLWKYHAELILQEYMPIDFDVRTLVLDGEIFASVKRRKSVSNDFRTNKALGNETEPYILSPKEKELIIRAANTTGCFYCGVDHVKVDGNLYVLEVNGSPGSGAAAYMSYYGDSDKKISGNQLIDNVVDYVSDTDHWIRNKKTVGVVEYATIEGMKIKSKLDTGNGSFNVIHAKKIKLLNNSRISFNFNGKTFVKKIIKTQNIRFGGGEDEDRYVVAMNMSMFREKNESIMFTLDDRTHNVYNVLIGKKYLLHKNYVVDVAKKFTHK